MRVGLIDVDGRTNRFGVRFPNIPLMRLAQYHKGRGDSVEWYNPMTSGRLDKVYVAKVFSFSEEYPYHINAKEVVRGGFRLLHRLNRRSREIRQFERRSSSGGH